MPRRHSLLLSLIALFALSATASAQATSSGTQVRKDGGAPRGQRNIVCRGAAVPSGWILVDDLRDTNSCGGDNPAALNAYNVWAIEKVTDRPSGSVIEVCASTPTPAGWTLVDVFRDKDRCGHPSELFAANVKRIRKN